MLVNPYNGSPLTPSEGGYVDPAGRLFPIREGVVCVAHEDGYAESFGFQWERFARTQLDREQDISLTRERFFASTRWTPEELDGQQVLEVGCGAGRFTQVVLEHTRAQLCSVDYSRAIWVNRRNHPASADRLKLFHASLYHLPFRRESFDRVFCLGVLQHTPDFRESVRCLAQMVKPGGVLAVDFYPIRGWWTKLHAKYLLRPLTRRVPHARLLQLIDRNIDWLLGAYSWFDRMGLGRMVNRFLPICDIRNTFPPNLTPTQVHEWAVLDTFDMFSPVHDHPQRVGTVARWFRESGLEVTHAGDVAFAGQRAAVVRGRKL